MSSRKPTTCSHPPMRKRTTNSPVRKHAIPLGEQVARAATRKLNKEEVDELVFSKVNGGWTAPKLYTCTPTMWKKLSDKKVSQIENQMRTQNNLNNSKKRSDITAEDSTNTDVGEDNSASNDINVDELLQMRPQIDNPFNKKHLSDETWRSPARMNLSRTKEFHFERPNPEHKTSSFTSPTATAKRHLNIIEEKDRHIGILREQLLKIHRESSVLAEQLARRRGPDATELVRRNKIMKDQLERCLTENGILRGKLIAQQNAITQQKMQQNIMRDKRHSSNDATLHVGLRSNNKLESFSGGVNTTSRAGLSVRFAPSLATKF